MPSRTARPCAAILLLVAGLALPSPAQRQDFSRPPAYELTQEENAGLQLLQNQLLERVKTLAETKPPRLSDASIFLRLAERAEQLAVYTRSDQPAQVRKALELGLRRCDEIEAGSRPWADQPGHSLRGYLSRVDGSIQPYGLVLPKSYRPDSRSWRLDVVLHGRGTDELKFLAAQEPGVAGRSPAVPEEPAIELHCFGRGNNGWRWAGETDVFEALEDVRSQYKIDPSRINLIGFSMGGHGAWHIGVHHPDLWASVTAGAGFSETKKYLESQEYDTKVPGYQEAAWKLYDAADYALNLFNTEFIGYGGELDRQLAAATTMKEAADRAGVPMTLLVGPKTGHTYHPDSLRQIRQHMLRAELRSRPSAVKFITWTLRYPRCFWVTIEGMERHYTPARVDAALKGGVLETTTSGVTALKLDPLPVGTSSIRIDGQEARFLPGHPLRLRREEGRWEPVRGEDKARRKRPGSQGPIDDAFTSHFIAVPGTGTPWDPAVQAYANRELERFRADWRYGFRGEVLVVTDKELRDPHVHHANLILFGDPGSNKVLARLVKRLPLKWTQGEIRLGKRAWKPGTVPVLVFPNPLNPARYIVINSGHTWTREHLDGTNALLTPKLPDWAMLRPTGDPVEKRPEVLAAGYFDERWEPAD